MDEVWRSRITAVGDLADAPEHGATGIQICRTDPQSPAFAMLCGDGRHNSGVDKASDQSLEWSRIDRRIRCQGAHQCLFAKNIFGRVLGVELSQRGIVVWAEKGERGDQGTGTDAGDERKFRPVVVPQNLVGR